MKPKIVKLSNGDYGCEIPIEFEPEEGAADDVWWTWAAFGYGQTPTDAYADWVLDCNPNRVI